MARLHISDLAWSPNGEQALLDGIELVVGDLIHALYELIVYNYTLLHTLTHYCQCMSMLDIYN